MVINGLTRTGVQIYLTQLRAMQKAGVLGGNKRLFAPLSGLDFIPGYFVGQMHTYDMRLPAQKVARGFETMHRAVARHFAEGNAFPSWRDFLCRVEHSQMNVLLDPFFAQIQAMARPGDVFLSKFMIDFLRIRETSGVAFQFVCKLIDVLPRGTFFVAYEKTPSIQKGTFPSVDLGLAEYLAGTGKFREITGGVFAGGNGQPLSGQAVSQAPESLSVSVRIGVDGNRRTFQVPLGGQLHILEKTA